MAGFHKTYLRKRVKNGKSDVAMRRPAQPPICPSENRPSCPICGGRPHKHGKQNNGVLRYRCPKCNIRFQAEYKNINKEGNPNWKGDNITKATGRDRARRWFSVPRGYERHHIDGNSKNNDPSNIEIVTRKAHMTEDGRLGKFRAFNAKRWGISS